MTTPTITIDASNTIDITDMTGEEMAALFADPAAAFAKAAAEAEAAKSELTADETTQAVSEALWLLCSASDPLSASKELRWVGGFDAVVAECVELAASSEDSYAYDRACSALGAKLRKAAGLGGR